MQKRGQHFKMKETNVTLTKKQYLWRDNRNKVKHII